MKIKVNVSCSMCQADQITSTEELDEGWSASTTIDIEDALCPEHAPICQFIDSQCPGCTGGWGDCPLWSSFAYSFRRTFNEDDAATLRKGICPRRVNGTFTVTDGEFGSLDLSNPAPIESGELLATAIEQYIERYPAS